MVTLMPQALALTIPMSLLLGLLVAFGRLSADREFVALQACGVSLRAPAPPGRRASRWSAGRPPPTSCIVAHAREQPGLPRDHLQHHRASGRGRGEAARLLRRTSPTSLLYVRDVPPTGGGWNDVFMADTAARSGPIRLPGAARTGAHRSREADRRDACSRTGRGTRRAGGRLPRSCRFDRRCSSVDPDSDVSARRHPPRATAR